MVLGIDLGTTYSVAAYVDEKGEPRVISNSSGDTTTPSVVYFNEEDKVIVGKTARDFLAMEPRRVISKVKNVIGRKDKDKKEKVYHPIPGKDFSPQDISSFVLRKLVLDAETFLGMPGEIKDVVVTVPAYFTDAQRSATNDAVKLAGLNLIANINEPTAAAIYYARQCRMEKVNAMVFDLGGGTFDVTLLHIDGSNVEVMSTKGLNNMGGTIFDDRLMDYLLKEFEEKQGIDLQDEEYEDVYQGLYEKVERAKKQICTNKTDTIIAVNAGGKKESIKITYDQFVSYITNYYDKIESTIKVAINEAGLKICDVDQVIMVGGSSRIPYIEERVSALMGKTPLRVVNPDEVVALGAAIQADVIYKNSENKVKDVCSHGFGFLRYNPEKDKKINMVMIPKNTIVPAKKKADGFAFASDDQPWLDVIVTEGDYEDEDVSLKIKQLRAKLPEGIKKGMAYEIEFAIDARQNVELTVFIPEISKKIVLNGNDKDVDVEGDEKEKAVLIRAKELQKIMID